MRVGAAVEGNLEFVGRGDVDAIDEFCHVVDDGRHRIGLHRVVDLDFGGQGRAQFGHAAIQQGAVVGVKRGLANLGGEASEGNAADEQFAVFGAELVHRRVSRFFAG